MIRPKLQLAALAAVAAMLSSGASAQSNVTLSGVLDEFAAIHHTGGQNIMRLDSTGLMASRVVFRGSEDLGDGLKANFWLESGFNPDTGSQSDSTRFFNRQAWVGLSSNTLGEARFGRLTSPQFFMEGQFDAFQGATMGSGFNDFIAYSIRFDNSAQYITPASLPVKLQLVTSLNEGNTGRRLGATVIAAEYKVGPVYIGINHANVQNPANLVVTKTTIGGGNVEFGPAKLYLGLFQGKADNGSFDRRMFSVSGSYDVMPLLSLVAGYARANDRTSANADGSQISAGFFYNLSKRTLIYGNVEKLDNKRTATFSLNTATAFGPTPQPGNNVDGVQLGIRHLF